MSSEEAIAAHRLLDDLGVPRFSGDSEGGANPRLPLAARIVHYGLALKGFQFKTTAMNKPPKGVDPNAQR